MDKNNTLLLDTGNLLFERYKEHETDIYAKKSQIITDAMNLMGYDAANLGAGDIYPDMQFLEQRCKDAQFAIISANAKVFGCEQNPVQKYVIKEINGIRIGITGVIPGFENNLLDRTFHFDDPATALEEIMPDLAEKTDFIILLSQFNYQDTRDLLNRVPGVDLGLCVDALRMPLPGSAEDKAKEQGLSALMNITIKGMEIGVLNIEKANGRVSIKSAEIIYLDQKVPADEKLLEVARQFEKWEKDKKTREMKKKLMERRKLMKNLELTPEEFFNQNEPSGKEKQ